MKGVYIGIIALFALGCAVSLYLIFSSEDYALMLLKGEKYSDADAYYRQKYQKGDRSASIMVPLKTLEIAKGENEQAIALMEEYVQQHPYDVNARKLLGMLYLNGQRRPEYLANLEVIYELKKSRKVLKELIGWYHAKGEKKKEEWALKELIGSGGGSAEHYSSLAYLLASRQEYAEALDLVRTQEKLFPQTYGLENVKFQIALLNELSRYGADHKKYDTEILNIARQFILSSPSQKEVRELIISLRTQKRADLAYQLIPAFKYFANTNLELEADIIELTWEIGDKEKAFDHLMQVYGTHSLNARLSDLLAHIAIEREYHLILLDLLEHSDPASLSDTTLLWFAVVAAQNKNSALTAEIESRLGESYLEAHPVVKIAFALAKGDVESEVKLRSLLRSQYITSSQALALMQLATYRGYNKMALEIGTSYMHFDQMSAQDLISWVLIFIELKKPVEALRILHAHKDSMKQRHEQALALLNTVLGNTDLAQQWFAQHKDLKKDFLVSLYLLADQAKSYFFALEIASRLYKNYPSLQNDTYYAQALFNSGKCAEALLIFRDLSKKIQSINIQMSYLQAMIKCGESREEIDTFLDHFLTTKLTDVQRREIAYLILEKLGDFKRAEELFLQLVQKSTPQISDIESLVYLIGPRPDKEIFFHILTLAKKAPSDEKMRWIKVLLSMNAYPTALELLLELPRASWTKTEYLLWINILTRLEDKEALKEALYCAFCNLKEAEDLKIVLQSAQGLGLLHLQREILNYLILIEPCNPLHWQSLGTIAYGLADFTSAIAYLNRYFSFGICNKDDYISLFFYGEMLFFRNDPLKAEAYYWAAMCALNEKETLTASMREMQATLYARLRHRWIGAQMLEQLYGESPNPDLRAAWANLLMEMGHLGAARRVLYCIEDAGFLKEACILIPWKEAVEATAKAFSNEVLITTSTPIASSDFENATAHLPPGIKRIETGHHSLLIATENPASFSVITEKDALNPEKYALRINICLYPVEFPPSIALGLARAQLALRERNYTYACTLLSQLLECYPENVDVLSLISSVEESIGKWQCSLNWMAKAHKLAPNNENVWTAFREIYFPHSAYIGYEREAMLTHATAAEQFHRLQGDWIVLHSPRRFVYLNTKVEMVRAHISQILNNEGLVEGFLGRRWRGHLRRKDINVNGSEFEYTLYAGDSVLGVGTGWLKRFDQGNFFFYADWNRPYWDILQALVHFGSENRAGIGGRYVYNARLDGFLDVGLRQYGQKGQRNATSTIRVQGNAQYYLTLKNPFFLLNYNLDAEYVYAIVEKVNAFGQLYQLLPLDSRENHTIRLVIRATWHKWWTLGGFFGETFNRLGTHNFTAGINFHYYYPCGLEIDFSMERYPSTTVTGEQVDDIKGAIRWRF